MERELANVVYIFTSPDQPGIKFYDRSPDGVMTKFVGSLPRGKFQTDIHSISQATWDNEINRENASQPVNAREGSFTATTIMVSPEQMEKILKTILNSEDKKRIVIDVLENQIVKDNTSDIEELKNLRKEVIEQLTTLGLNEKSNSNDIKYYNTNNNIKK